MANFINIFWGKLDQVGFELPLDFVLGCKKEWFITFILWLVFRLNEKVLDKRKNTGYAHPSLNFWWKYFQILSNIRKTIWKVYETINSMLNEWSNEPISTFFFIKNLAIIKGHKKFHSAIFTWWNYINCFQKIWKWLDRKVEIDFPISVFT